MTAITLHLEDSLVTKLKKKAKEFGVNIDSYILAQLNKMVPEETDRIDVLLASMQLKGHDVPADETGKGALANSKYIK